MDVDTNLESDFLGSTVAHVDRCADYTVIINLLEHWKYNSYSVSLYLSFLVHCYYSSLLQKKSNQNRINESPVSHCGPWTRIHCHMLPLYWKVSAPCARGVWKRPRNRWLLLVDCSSNVGALLTARVNPATDEIVANLAWARSTLVYFNATMNHNM